MGKTNPKIHSSIGNWKSAIGNDVNCHSLSPHVTLGGNLKSSAREPLPVKRSANEYSVKESSKSSAATQSNTRLRELTDELQQLEAKLRLGGGPEKIERQHKQGKLTARERLDLLLDKDSYVQEIGLLVAYDQYDGGAPGAGVVTVVGRVEGREVVVVANDATVKAGSWWPETIKKILRAQEIRYAPHVPIIYLVDSAE